MKEPLQRVGNILNDNKGYVELLDIMPHYLTGVTPDMAVVGAARVSRLENSKGEEADKKLLFYLMKNRHTSPFEQVEFKFRIKAPVITFWQLVRHRTWHYNFQSGRYAEYPEDDFYIPTEWRLQSKTNKQGSEGCLDDFGAEIMDRRLKEIMEDGYSHYQHALSLGVAKEQARLFLPAWCIYYTAICKVDAWNLMHFLKLRMGDNAQYEIRQYANALYRIFGNMMPWTKEAFDKFYFSCYDEDECVVH